MNAVADGAAGGHSAAATATWPPSSWRLVRSRHGGRPLVISGPPRRRDGQLALAIHLALSYAIESGADVYFVRDANTASSALYQIDTTAARILRPTALRDARFGARLRLEEWNRRRRRWGRELARAAHDITREALDEYCVDPRVPPRLQRRLREVRRRLDPYRPGGAAERTLRESASVERWRLRAPIESFIRRDVAPVAREQAAAIGVRDGMKLVCIHAGDDAATGSARIETYFAAVDRLVARGYTVVRLGDPSMPPARRAGVIDMAAHGPAPLAELYCMFRSDFIVCGEPGPRSLAYLANTPLVTVNGVDPIGSYPIRRDGFYIPKGALDRLTGRRLAFHEMFGEEYLANVGNTKRFVYVDNTPAEIAALVDEVLEWIDGRHVETAAQTAFRSMATELFVGVRQRMGYVTPHGLDRGFLGDGRIGRSYLDQYSSHT